VYKVLAELVERVDLWALHWCAVGEAHRDGVTCKPSEGSVATRRVGGQCIGSHRESGAVEDGISDQQSLGWLV
jgi:hypothetical protein